MKTFRPIIVLFIFAGAACALRAEKVVRDVTFAVVDKSPLQLDLYLPYGRADGLIVWVHGGAWRGGSRERADFRPLVTHGWAVASVDYRLSTVARFPAQVHDIKAAIRFLRAHAAEYGYPPEPFVVAGSSAGGHLAALVGVTNGKKELEGKVGDNPSASSSVQAVVSLYGASNLTTILSQSTPHGLETRIPALDLLLGGPPETVPELAKLASPVFHVDASDPPLLLEHGDQDQQMPINQSHELQGAYEKVGRPVVFKVVHGAPHGGPTYTTEENFAFVDRFLREHLPQRK